MATRNLQGDDPRYTRRYLTPAKDFLVREKVRDDEAGRLTIGTAHKVVSVYPDFKVCAFQPGDEEGWQYVFYLKTREAQNAYNYEFANVLSEEFPTIRQDFVFLRSEWTPAQSAPATELPPTFSVYTWTFIEEVEKRGEEIEDGLFVRVQRVWRDLTTALISKTVDPEMGDTRTTTRTLVAASTEAAVVDASGNVTEIQPVNTKFSWQTTRALAGMPALAGGTGVYEDSLDKEMNWPWPAVLSHVQVNAVYSDPGNAFSSIDGYNVVPIYLSPGYQGKCQCTEIRRWTKKKPIRTGDAGWYWGPTWTAGSYSTGDFRSYDGESYIALTNHSGSTPPPDDATNWRVSSPLLRSADKLLPMGITFIGVDLGRIVIPPCLHGRVVLNDSQTTGTYPATSPRLWPETILADVQLSRYPGGGYLTQEFWVDAPNDDGVAGDIELEVVSLGATSAVVQWTGETTGSVTATYLDVSTDPDFGFGFLTGFNGAVVTPGSLGTPKQATITGMVRGTAYYARIRRGALTSNTERVVGVPQAEITLLSGSVIADGGTLAFGNATVGSTANTKTITIANDGLRNLDGISVAFSGTNSADWTAASVPTSVSFEDSTTFVVTCNPAATGSRTGVMTVTSNAPGNPSYVVNLTATGQSPEINVTYSSTSYASGSVVPLAGTTSGGSYTDYTLTIQNSGTGDLTVTAGIVSPDGSMTIQTAPPTPVAQSGSTTMVVRFTPVVDGGAASTLTLTNNDANESSYVLTLQAEAVCVGTLSVTNPLGVVAASGGTYEFGSLDYASGGADGVRAKSFVVENAGVGTLSSISAALSGADAAEFSITSTYADSLEPGATTSIEVTLNTGLPAGSKTATLTITSSDPATPSYTVTLTGVSVSAPTPEIQVECPVGTVLVDAGNTLDFGAVLTSGGTATKTLRIRNIGCDTLSSLAMSNSGGNTGDFTYSSVTTSLTDDTSQNVVATFNPGAHGVRTTELRIASNDATENPFNITMTGVGLPANALLTAQAAGVFIGQASATALASTLDSATLAYADAVAVSSTGRVAVCDTFNNRVLIWNTMPTTSGVAASIVLGQANFTTNAAAVTSAGLTSPQGVCWHGNNLWVADTGSSRVLRYSSPSTSGQAASLVVGQANFTSGSSAVSATRMNQPVGVLIHASKLYVADRSNNRVLVFNTLPASNGASASFALGQASGGSNLTSSTATTSGANLVYGMSLPRGLAVSSTGKLMVVDTGNNRVMIYSGLPTAGGASASLVLFQSSLTTTPVFSTVSSTRTNSVQGIAVSSTGVIAITDSDFDRVLLYYDTPTTDDAPAHAVLGQPNMTTSTAWASNSATNMNSPSGVAWNGTSLIVSGQGMKRAMRFSPA